MRWLRVGIAPGRGVMRWLAAVVGATSLLVGPGAAVRAAEAVTFSYSMGSCTIHGTSEYPTFRLQVLDATAVQLALVDLTTLPNKSWSTPCLPLAMKAGYHLIAWDGDKAVRIFRAPPFALRVDRAADTVTVTGPPSTALQFTLDACYAADPRPITCYGGVIERSFVTDAQGRYHEDFSSGDDLTDIRGGDRATLQTSSLGGDSIVRRETVPYLQVDVGKAKVHGRGRPGRSLRVTLKSAAGAVRGTASATASISDGTWTTTVRRNGAKVPVRVGDRVVSDLATDARLTVRAVSAVADLATGYVNGTCFPSGWYGLRVLDQGGVFRREEYGIALGNGGWSERILDVDHGWKLEQWCQTVRGDVVHKVTVVP